MDLDKWEFELAHNDSIGDGGAWNRVHKVSMVGQQRPFLNIFNSSRPPGAGHTQFTS